MSSHADQDVAVTRTVRVPLPPQRAFDLFTTRMIEFWPATHTIGASPMTEVVIEPHPGGRWFERGEDGSECAWGRVTVWDPPGRLVLLWQIGADWQHDPSLETDVDITFTAEGPAATRVDLRHGHLERFGDATESIRAVFDSPGGWSGILGGFVTAARQA